MNFLDVENSTALPIHEYRPTADDVIFHCADCNEVLDQSEWDNESQGLKFCFSCWRNYHWCVFCDQIVRGEEPVVLQTLIKERVDKIYFHRTCKPKWDAEQDETQ